ncbi:oxidoreductase [Ktedonobacter sp. SOSP1-85]|uniref:pyridoxamine 5'-phosphate oxidase family protein n=1 Tax=Ktedonobacter sp. SOSP1-85 TaxID=2778367 RepID=UPI0019156ECF|nr:pyridoxamine 5'-phosphate oxidase family protein [Ktedonobacter sp. SOSP1-85]GHO76159.1 oxidoreductase [Ktedonobacter sp. SOSP1-85]
MLDYHAGELEVQGQAGIPPRASRVNKSLRPTLPPIAQTFLHEQYMVVLSTTDSERRVWASILAGEPGFLKTPDEQTVKISAAPGLFDPLSKNLQIGGAIGMIMIDFATRRRMRVNGRIKSVQGEIVVHTEQVYSNCPKYIQARVLPGANTNEPPSSAPLTPQLSPEAVCNAALTSEQRTWIERADTFFIASSHREGGSDVSHRGGTPGFVQVENATRLVFPDYSGNRMFQTLGNISVEPQTGLLFLDFKSGDTLQLTGKAQVIWEKERVAAFAGAERLVEFSIEEVIETKGAVPLHWQLVEYSPFLP